MRLTHQLLKEAWMKDVGYLRIANELQLDPDMVKSLYDQWTKESLDDYLEWMATRK
jgi:hypothetical protein